jgi:hypothetical protein
MTELASNTNLGTPAHRVPRVSTLLNLVQVVQDETDSDEEVVAVISNLLSTGQVRLCGIFADRPVRFAA